MVAFAVQRASCRTALELFEVHPAHVVEGQSQFSGELGDVPENVAQFESKVLLEAFINHPVPIPDQFLHLLSHLSSFSGKSQRWINQIASKIGVAGRCSGVPLVIIELHGGEAPTGLTVDSAG